MKNIFRFIAASASKAVALAGMGLLALALSGCTQSEIAPDTVPTHTVRFTADGPLTKTTMAIDGTTVTFNWSTEDIARLKVWENGEAGTIDTEKSKINDGLLTLFASFPGEATPGQKTYTAILNGSVGDQTPGEDSYDEAADILIAKPVEAEPTTEGILFQFGRPVAINKMTLCDLPAEQTLSTVTVSSDKPIAGTIEGDDWDSEKAGNSLTLNVNRAIPESGEVVLYYTSVPAEDATLSVDARVGTDSYYKKFGRTLTTTAGDVKGYSVGLNKRAHITLRENFNAINASTNKYGCQSNLSTDGNSDGLDYEWTPDGSVFVFKNGVRLGTSGASGSISNSSILTDIPAGTVLNVNVFAATWGTDNGDIKLSYNGQTTSQRPSQSIESPNDKVYSAGDISSATTFTITKAEGVNAITLSTDSGKRVIIDRLEVEIYCDESGQKPSATVTSGNASNIGQTVATLSGSYSAATSTATGTYFLWGTDRNSLINTLEAVDNDGAFAGTLSGLTPNTIYYYKACATVKGTEIHALERDTFQGEIKSFQTAQAQSYSVNGWLELPAEVDKTAISGCTPSTLSDLTVLTHFISDGDRNYTLLYDPGMYASYWVAYPLAKGHKDSGRTDSFDFDPDIPASKQTDIKHGGYGVEYASNNPYARGHQIPNADRNANVTAQAQTYYATNMTPQIQNGFNSGIWSELEKAIRDAVPESVTDSLYVVTGAAFKKVGGSENITTIINSNDGKTLPVPNYYWKVILKVKRSGETITNATTIGFWLPHKKIDGSNYATYATSVDQIETWTGFDFFKNLPSELQTSAETNDNWEAFKGF